MPTDIEEDIIRGHLTGRLTVASARGVPLFADLRADALLVLSAAGRWRACRRHEMIAGPGEVHRDVFVIAGGLVRFYLLVDCRELTVLVLSVGEILDLALLPPDLTEIAYVQATREGTVVYRIPREVVRRVMLSTPATAEGYLDQQSAQMWRSVQAQEAFAYHSAESRLAHTVARLAGDASDGFVDYTHEELGQMCGLPRAEVTSLLASLRRRRWVEFTSHVHGIRVLDRGALMHLR